MVEIIVNNVYSQINGLTDIHIIDKLDSRLSFYQEGYQFSPAYKRHTWDGKVRLLNKQLKFQTGLLIYVEELLKANDIEYRIIDNRQDPILGKEIQLNPNYYTPRDYQIKSVEECLKHKCGIVKSCTGSGKTLSLSMLIGKTNIKTLVCVISLDLLYQTKKDIEDALGIECGIIGNGECKIKKITVGTPWTIVRAYDKDYKPFDSDEEVVKESLDQLSKIKIQKMVENAQMLIIDECQQLASASHQHIAKSAINARYKISLSGTPWRNGPDSILIEASSGQQLIDITATELIGRKILVPPIIYFFDVPELDGYNKRDNKSYAAIYEGYIVNNKIRNEMIVESAEKLYNKGRKTLILIKRKSHGMELLKMMPAHIKSYFLNGDAPAEERQAVKDLFNADGLDVIIGSTIYDQGIDLPKLDALILAGGGASSGRALQRLGRVIRGFPGKENAIVVDYIDNANYLYSHSKKRYDTYTVESAFQIKLPENIDW